MAALQKIRSSSWIIGHLVCAEKFQQQRWFCVWQEPFAAGLL